MIQINLTDGTVKKIQAASVREIVCSVFGDRLIITTVDGNVYETTGIQCLNLK